MTEGRAPLRFSGAVLTGGASRRMGRDKALVEVGGRALALGVASALAEAGAAHLFSVGGDVGALRALGLEAIPDQHPGAGPVGGLLTALGHASEPVVAVLACDLLAARAQAIRRVVAALGGDPEAACACPVVDGRRQPLHAAWRRTAQSAVRSAFDRGERAMHRILAGLRCVEVTGIDPGALVDADTPEDLAMAPPAPSF